MLESETPEPGESAQETEILSDEVLIEREIIGRAGQTTEEKIAWVEKYAAQFREIMQDPEIVRLIKENRTRAIEEIERRLYGK